MTHEDRRRFHLEILAHVRRARDESARMLFAGASVGEVDGYMDEILGAFPELLDAAECGGGNC